MNEGKTMIGTVEALTVNGYIMFYGTATVTPIGSKPVEHVTGTWFYRPDVNWWYCSNGENHPAEIMSDFREAEE